MTHSLLLPPCSSGIIPVAVEAPPLMASENDRSILFLGLLGLGGESSLGCRVSSRLSKFFEDEVQYGKLYHYVSFCYVSKIN